jgi:hypothetical protein
VATAAGGGQREKGEGLQEACLKPDKPLEGEVGLERGCNPGVMTWQRPQTTSTKKVCSIEKG